MKQFYFERLEVWQESRRLVKDLYLITADFPVEEKFGVTSQLRREHHWVYVLILPKEVPGNQKKTKPDLLIKPLVQLLK